MLLDIQSPADAARARFIDRAVEIANLMGSRKVMALADAALALRGEPEQLWDAITYQLNAWQRVANAKHDETAARFDALARSLRSDVRWEVDHG